MYPLAIVHRAWKHVREQIRVMVYLSSHAKDIRCHTISIGHFAADISISTHSSIVDRVVRSNIVEVLLLKD